MNEQQVIVIGAGGHGKEIAAYAKDLLCHGTKVRIAGFIDDGKPKGSFAGSALLGNLDDLKRLLDGSVPFHFITAVGDNAVRKQLVNRIERLQSEHLFPWTLLHPKASIGTNVRIGGGTCLAPFSCVTTDVEIGAHCIVNVHTSISHDCTIGPFVNINPGVKICGNVAIGEGCYIGAGATLIDKVSVGPWTVIGAGAVVTKDIPAHVTAVGVPACIVKEHERQITGI